MRRKNCILVGLFFIVVFIMSVTVKADIFVGEGEDTEETDGKRVIKVAYYERDNYFSYDEDGEIQCYDRAYLEKASEYTDLEFEFVNCGSFNNALSMLKNHEIDLIGHMLNNEAREEEFEFCKRKYGVTYSVLSSIVENGIVYEDYDSIADCRIGVVDTYVCNEELFDYIKELPKIPRIIHYETVKAMAKALEQKEIDLAFSSERMTKAEWLTVERFSYKAIYFASYLGNEKLVDEIDDALLKIDLYESEYNNQIINQYFPKLNNIPFSKEELEYISTLGTIDVYFNDKTSPISYVDSKTGEMKGILVDTCELIAKECGINFSYHSKEREELTDSESIYGYMSFRGFKQEESNYIYSNPLLNSTFSLYHFHNDEKNATENKNYTVAIPTDRAYFQKYIEKKYPTYSVKVYDDPKACLMAVYNKEVDFAFLNEYVGNELIIEYAFEGIDVIPETSSDEDFVLMYTVDSNPLLQSIINKGISRINERDIEKIVTNYVLRATPEMIFNYLLKEHFGFMVTIIVFLAASIVAVSIIFVRNRSLQKEKIIIEENAVSLNEERRKAVAASEAKSSFLSRMSHEIRTPINAIMGYSVMLKSDMKKNGENKKQIEKLDEINRSSKYLLSIINDILDTSKIESGRLALKEDIVYVREYMKSIVDMIEPIANKKGLHFTYKDINHLNEAYIGDEHRIQQILMNILNNSVKFTPAGGSIEMISKEEAIDNEHIKITITVEDTGIGMSQEFIDNELFNPFSQEDMDLTSPYEGSGLGLSISKDLVKLMNGNIVCESKKGEGSKFTITFVLKGAKKKNAIKDQEDFYTEGIHKSLKGKNILVCEDHPVNQTLVKEMLERQGCNVFTVPNGQIAVDLFWHKPMGSFDAILMDIRMPVLDGLSATKRIRELPREDSKTIPIIALSANAYSEDINKSMAAGMNVHLSKPVDMEILCKTLEKFTVNRF